LTLGVGTAPLGGLYSSVSDEQAHETLEEAWRLGLRVFDTAPLYGLGVAEERLGRFLATKPRDEFVISTKVGRLIRPASEAEPAHDISAWVDNVERVPVFDFSSDGALRSLEESLERLQLDHVDILFIHDPDDHFDDAMRGAYPALERLRSEGVVEQIGAGMNQVEMLTRFARETDMDRFLVAGRYTLLEQPALAELLPLCVEKGSAVTAGGVFNSGVLADPQPSATYNYEAADSSTLARARKLAETCRQHDVSLKAAALQFPLRHSAIDVVLTGVRSKEEIAENVEHAATAIPRELWEALGVG
jgi:D-threo-aldose 1-dehydrogenase